MAYAISGFVMFEFKNVLVDDDDQYEAQHIVKAMSAAELVDYSDDRGNVTITKLRVLS